MKVEYIDSMGSDLSVVDAARVSFDKQSCWYTKADGTKALKDTDEKLVKYLAKHNHWSPFAHTSISLRVKAPIFIARQLAKHQVGGAWNEVSRRYVDSEPEFYTPKTWRKRAENVKQGSSDEEVEMLCMGEGGEQVRPLPKLADRSGNITRTCRNIEHHLQEVYKEMVLSGVCPEQARMVLPQSMYTEWIWTGSVYFFANVYNLRSDPHAQKEVQEVAEMIKDVVEPLYPVSWKELTQCA